MFCNKTHVSQAYIEGMKKLKCKLILLPYSAEGHVFTPFAYPL